MRECVLVLQWLLAELDGLVVLYLPCPSDYFSPFSVLLVIVLLFFLFLPSQWRATSYLVLRGWVATEGKEAAELTWPPHAFEVAVWDPTRHLKDWITSSKFFSLRPPSITADVWLPLGPGTHLFNFLSCHINV